MNAKDKATLRSNLVKIVKELYLDEMFLANLESENILTGSMVEELKVGLIIYHLLNCYP